MLIFAAIGIAVTTLAHMLPVPFVLDWMAGDVGVWHMPRRADLPTVYLTYDDGPNPSTTPDLLDVLRAENVHATFFLIDEHITAETVSIVARLQDEGHAIGLHASSRRPMLMAPSALAEMLTAAAGRVEAAGGRPCRAFRPHAGWRGGQMYEGLKALDYQLIGWGWMLWDFNWFRPREAEPTFRRVASRVADGDIVVMHDGDESAPTRDQRQTVEATMLLIPELRARGFTFGKIC
jgi:peptidoglycan/xylan/chitin deacetylase (PgdA/CDA1 family)